MEVWRLAAGRNKLTQPKHVWVKFGDYTLPGLLIEWRPRRERGGVSRWEGLVIYARQDFRSGSTTVTQSWVHGDMLRKA